MGLASLLLPAILWRSPGARQAPPPPPGPMGNVLSRKGRAQSRGHQEPAWTALVDATPQWRAQGEQLLLSDGVTHAA